MQITKKPLIKSPRRIAAWQQQSENLPRSRGSDDTGRKVQCRVPVARVSANANYRYVAYVCRCAENNRYHPFRRRNQNMPSRRIVRS